MKLISIDQARKARKVNRLPGIPKGKMIIILVATIIAIVLGVVLATRPNAYEVKVADQVLGIVKGQDVPEQSLAVVTANLQDTYQADVRIVNELEVIAVHASKKKLVTPDYLISQLKENVEWEIQMIELVIDGDSKGIFKNKAEADEIIQKVIDIYTPKGLENIKEAKLEAKVDYKNVYVSEDQLSDPEKIYAELTQTTEEDKVYTVAAGDNLWGICDKNDMEIEELLRINPDITEETVLQIGQELNVKLDKPAISVQVTEAYTKEEEFMPDPIITEDPNQYTNYRKSVSPGKLGKKITTVNKIYIDGLLQETVDKGTEIIDQGEGEKITVGTKEL